MEEKYESIGKKYNGEKAIISLTSWKARIDTVGKTLFSLLVKCPGFHIVLVLSEEEFPQKEKELPDDLMLFIKKKFIEILWVYKNYKSLKKVLFTMDKYRDVPVISADDDCVYKFNYAKDFYDIWVNHKDYFICYWCAYNEKYKCYNTSGYATLHPPYIYGDCLKYLNNDKLIEYNQDDLIYLALRIKKGLKNVICLNKPYEKIVCSHDEIKPLHDTYRKDKYLQKNTINDVINFIVNN